MNAFYTHIEVIWWTHCKQMSKYKGNHDLFITLIMVSYVHSCFIISWKTSFLFMFYPNLLKCSCDLYSTLLFSIRNICVPLYSERHRDVTWICMKDCNDDETILGWPLNRYIMFGRGICEKYQSIIPLLI